MSSVMRWRSGVMESSFARWNVLQAATPCFRTGALGAEDGSAVERAATTYSLGGCQIPRSGLVQLRFHRHNVARMRGAERGISSAGRAMPNDEIDTRLRMLAILAGQAVALANSCCC